MSSGVEDSMDCDDTMQDGPVVDEDAVGGANNADGGQASEATPQKKRKRRIAGKTVQDQTWSKYDRYAHDFFVCTIMGIRCSDLQC